MRSCDKRNPPVAPILVLALTVLLLLLAGLWVVVVTSSVSGSATLPNGAALSIAGNALGFSVAANDNSTRVEIGGRVIEFGTSAIAVDDNRVGALGDGVKQVALTVNRGRVRIEADGRTVSIVD